MDANTTAAAGPNHPLNQHAVLATEAGLPSARPNLAAAQLQQAEPTHAAVQLQHAEPTHAAAQLQHADPTHAAVQLRHAEPTHAPAQLQHAGPAHAAAQLQHAEPIHAAAQLQHAEPALGAPELRQAVVHDGAEERRRHPRAPVELLVELKFDSVQHFLAMYAEDISESGMFLRTEHAGALRAVGEELELSFDAGNRRIVQGRGCVVRVISPGDPSVSSGIAIQFVELDETSRKLVEAIVRIKLASVRTS